MSIEPIRHQPHWKQPPPRARALPPARPCFVGGDGPNGLGKSLALFAATAYVVACVVVVVPWLMNERNSRIEPFADPAATQMTADGYSNLPGGYAELSYNPQPSDVEWRTGVSEDGPYDGSVWGVRCDCGDDYMMLSFTLNQPRVNTPTQRKQALDEAHEEALEDADGPVKFSTEQVSSGESYAFRYRSADDKEVLRLWVIRSERSYRLECRAGSPDSPQFSRCQIALSSLRVEV